MKELIANIFGLHIGCKVRYGINKPDIMDIDLLYTIVSCDCFESYKLILKPLSSITEEDKREFEETIYMADKDEKITFAKEVIFLASRGYDVGIVPDEYKEVV